jgi:hypothetical protein
MDIKSAGGPGNDPAVFFLVASVVCAWIHIDCSVVGEIQALEPVSFREKVQCIQRVILFKFPDPDFRIVAWIAPY